MVVEARRLLHRWHLHWHMMLSRIGKYVLFLIPMLIRMEFAWASAPLSSFVWDAAIRTTCIFVPITLAIILNSHSFGFPRMLHVLLAFSLFRVCLVRSPNAMAFLLSKLRRRKNVLCWILSWISARYMRGTILLTLSWMFKFAPFSIKILIVILWSFKEDMWSGAAPFWIHQTNS